MHPSGQDIPLGVRPVALDHRTQPSAQNVPLIAPSAWLVAILAWRTRGMLVSTASVCSGPRVKIGAFSAARASARLPLPSASETVTMLLTTAWEGAVGGMPTARRTAWRASSISSLITGLMNINLGLVLIAPAA